MASVPAPHVPPGVPPGPWPVTGWAASMSRPSPAVPSKSRGIPRTSPISPATSRPVPIGPSRSERAPACRSTHTGASASAFMTTSAHRPGSKSHEISWEPGPEAETLQKSCSPGGSGTRFPAVVRAVSFAHGERPGHGSAAAKVVSPREERATSCK